MCTMRRKQRGKGGHQPEQRRHLLGNGPCGHRATAAILTLKVSNPEFCGDLNGFCDRLLTRRCRDDSIIWIIGLIGQ